MESKPSAENSEEQEELESREQNPKSGGRVCEDAKRGEEVCSVSSCHQARASRRKECNRREGRLLISAAEQQTAEH